MDATAFPELLVNPSPLPSPASDAPKERRHDLDALRAAAMLLGIAYHAALSFSLGDGWIVRDVSQSKALYLFQAFVHGFRMQLFMILSGFFTAMLWRKRGLKALLWHRFRRVLLPCLIGLITVIPAMNWADGFAAKKNTEKRRNSAQNVGSEIGVRSPMQEASPQAFTPLLDRPEWLTRLHPESVAALFDKGADTHWRSPEGYTALQGAAFLERSNVAELQIRSGTDVNARRLNGNRPRISTPSGYSTVERINRPLGIRVEKEHVLRVRPHVLNSLSGIGGGKNAGPVMSRITDFQRTLAQWTETPVFSVLWFLWFLVWLTLLFSIYAFAAERSGWRMRPHALVISQASLLWLVPLTLLPAWFMKSSHGEFGPDTSMGILPMPHALAYYALFFGFGVLYFECANETAQLGRSWRRTFPVSLLLVFPLAMEFTTGIFGFGEKLLPYCCHRAAAVVFQALYAWMMSFAWMGLFRSALTRESSSIRYISDASYWFYLAHLPLVIVMQALVAEWALPALPKFFLTCASVSLLLLLSYDKLVRYSLVGILLNGHRLRPAKTIATPRANV